jgi:transcriptional regulator with GAF, ATPase, and Fis domain
MGGRNVSENTAQSADLRLRRYEALLGPSKAIATHRNLPDLLHHLAGHLRDLFDFHNLGIMLHDASRNVLCLHILEINEPAMWRFPTGIPIEGSITGWVWQNQQPFATSDVCLEICFPATKMVLDTPLRSVCVLPLTTRGDRLSDSPRRGTHPLKAQDRLAESEPLTATTLVAVYRTLGGGWEMAPEMASSKAP